ncbi:MAG: MFS transporter [Gudongella sp.]|jgi:MFS family permease|nr:MFS transporter [Gudongella sp.]
MAERKNTAKLWSRNFITIIISHFFLLFGFQVLLPTIPLFANNFTSSETIIGLVSGLFTISAVLIRPVSGGFLDKSGRRIVLSISLIIFILSSLSYTFVTTIGAFLLLRFLHGIGWGSSNTASDTVATDNIPQERFGEGMGFFGLSMSLGMVVGPAVGMSIADKYGFNTLFFTSALLVFLSLIISSTIKYEPTKKKTKDKALITFDRESVEPAIIMALITISYGAIVSFFPIYAQQQGIVNIGAFFTVYASAIFVIRPFLGKIIDKYGFDYTVIPGIILVAVSMLFMGLSLNMTSYLLIAVVYGMGFGACQLSFQTMAIINKPQNERGGANAIFYVGFDGGITIGSILFGYFASLFGYSHMYLITVIPAVLALVGYVFFVRKISK